MTTKKKAKFDVKKEITELKDKVAQANQAIAILTTMIALEKQANTMLAQRVVAAARVLDGR